MCLLERIFVNPANERIKYVTAVVLYGTIGTFLRFVNVPGSVVAMFRGLLGCAFILLYLKATHRSLDREAVKRNRRWLVPGGIALGLNWIFLFAAYLKTTVAIASLCNYMAPVLVILAAPLLLREKPDPRKLPCVAVALVGIVLVSGVWKGNVGSPAGIASGLLAAVCFAAVVICNRKLVDISPLDRAVVQLGISALTILPYCLAAEMRDLSAPDLRSVMIVLMLGFIHTGAAYCLYFSGMGSLPVQTVAILGYLEPVVSVLCSAFFLRERMGPTGWAGAAMIIGAAIVSEVIGEKHPDGRKEN